MRRIMVGPGSVLPIGPDRAGSEGQNGLWQARPVTRAEGVAADSLPEHDLDSRRGWVVVAAAFLSMFVVYGIVYSFGTFFDSMAEDFGTGKGATALMFSITTAWYFGLGLVSGKAADRYGPRPILVVAAGVLGVALLLTSRVALHLARLPHLRRRGRHRRGVRATSRWSPPSGRGSSAGARPRSASPWPASGSARSSWHRCPTVSSTPTGGAPRTSCSASAARCCCSSPASARGARR